jgi:hypothetical protein
MNTVLTDHLLLFMEGRSHRNPQGLGLLAPGNNAPVVVREHDDRLVQEGRVKDPLAGAKEVVAVDQSDAGHGQSSPLSSLDDERILDAGLGMLAVHPLTV